MTEADRTRIHRLDDVTASRIAAGEVVERPASVVKELVENSLDAGASRVEVEIREGGRRLIRVTDDGGGIADADVELALARHATSKLRSASDLDAVRTLGFRGEALASIAAVSHLTLVTRTPAEGAATQVRVEAGSVASRGRIGAPVGTQVTVENLFHAVPARLKFLRSAASEAAQIAATVGRYALAAPSCRLRLVRDGKEVLLAPGTGDMIDAIGAVLGRETARALIPLEQRFAEDLAWEDRQRRLSITGFAGPPHVHRATRKDVRLLVNGRPVQDAQLVFAIVQAYRTLLPTGRFPVAIVRVELPPDAVDVNVHPAKTEVRFREPRRVFSGVQGAVRDAIEGASPIPAVRERANATAWSPPGSIAYGQRPLGDAEPLPPSEGPTRLPGLPPLRLLGQIALAYIAAEGPDGLYLIDQHAAHERVMYEELTARPGRAAAQRLLAPEPVQLTAEQASVVADRLEAFSSAGFDVEPFGGDSVLVRAVPEVLSGGDVAQMLRTVIDLADEGRAAVDDAFEARLIRAVCKRASVKAGQALSEDEMRSLLRRLERTKSPRTCPHGRPTVVALPVERLAAEFGRH